MVHFGYQADRCGGTTPVGTLNGGNSFGKRCPGFAAVGRRAGDRAKVNMTGGRKQIDVILTAAQVPAPIYSIEISFEEVHHQFISIVVVIAVARGAVQQHLSLALEPGKIEPPASSARRTCSAFCPRTHAF